jgi:uncharacterized protein (TIGR02301 family)
MKGLDVKNTIRTIVFLGLLMPLGTSAQNFTGDQGRYQSQLIRISEILGELHHLRGSCVSGEHQLWRDNMMELVRLEEPSPARKNTMVSKFNQAYERSKKRYPKCGRQLRDRAHILATEGADLSNTLANSISG